MLRTIFALAALLAASPAWAIDSDGSRPDDKLTPGEVWSTSREEICARPTSDRRDVSVTTKVAVRRAYGIMTPLGGWCGNLGPDGKPGCEIDHRCALGVGCDNRPGSIANLWPQRPDGPYGYHVKDLCEAHAHRSLCAGEMTPVEAQAIFLRGDWRVNCETAFPDLKSLPGWNG